MKIPPPVTVRSEPRPDRSVPSPGARLLLGAAAGLFLNGIVASPFFVHSGVARAEDRTPLELLEKTEDPAKQPSFRGKKVSVDFTRPFPQVSNWTITHVGIKQERMERISPKGKQEEIVIIKGREKLHYLTKQGLLVREIIRGEHPGFDPDRKNLDLARKNYTIEKVGLSKVDARPVVRIHLQSRFSGRPRQEIWIDPEVGLSLRSEFYGKSGNLSSMETFSDVEINPNFSDTVLQLNLPREIRRAEVVVYPQPDLAAAAASFGHQVYLPDFLPEGFVLRGIVLNRIGNLSRLQFIYSDGITGLSVFEERYRPEPESALRPRFLPEDGFLSVSQGLTNLLAFLKGEMKMVVVGELEKEEIHRVAESLKPVSFQGGKPDD